MIFLPVCLQSIRLNQGHIENINNDFLMLKSMSPINNDDDLCILKLMSATKN